MELRPHSLPLGIGVGGWRQPFLWCQEPLSLGASSLPSEHVQTPFTPQDCAFTAGQESPTILHVSLAPLVTGPGWAELPVWKLTWGEVLHLSHSLLCKMEVKRTLSWGHFEDSITQLMESPSQCLTCSKHLRYIGYCYLLVSCWMNEFFSLPSPQTGKLFPSQYLFASIRERTAELGADDRRWLLLLNHNLKTPSRFRILMDYHGSEIFWQAWGAQGPRGTLPESPRSLPPPFPGAPLIRTCLL